MKTLKNETLRRILLIILSLIVMSLGYLYAWGRLWTQGGNNEDRDHRTWNSW